MIRYIAALLALCVIPAAHAACGPEALGTSRVLIVDPASTPRVGLKSFPQTLPLADKEVVLTFDDGPHPPTTRKVLDALAKECTRATFFLVGKEAVAQSAMVKEMAAQGHTLAHHSYSHPNMGHVSYDSALRDIDRGIAADELALNGRESSLPSTPFFRFPYFESTPALLDTLQKRNIAVFGADFWASDWNPMTPAAQLQLIVARLEETRRGIILFHDTKGQTAAMLPDFLRYLRTHGFRVVHIVPVQQAKPATPAR